VDHEDAAGRLLSHRDKPIARKVSNFSRLGPANRKALHSQGFPVSVAQSCITGPSLTRSSDFPTTHGAFQPAYAGGEDDAFVTQPLADLSRAAVQPKSAPRLNHRLTTRLRAPRTIRPWRNARSAAGRSMSVRIRSSSGSLARSIPSSAPRKRCGVTVAGRAAPSRKRSCGRLRISSRKRRHLPGPPSPEGTTANGCSAGAGDRCSTRSRRPGHGRRRTSPPRCGC
jgi:hypothetical protein